MKKHKTCIALWGLMILCIFMVPVSAYQFSMTNVENYDSLTDLYPDGTYSHAYVYNWLTGQGWTQSFYATDASVDDTDFATSGGGLDNADLHYHFGHGDWISGTTHVQYSNWPTSSLTRSEVYKKWGSSLTSANKWIVLDTCWDLYDLQWGGALKYSHGILGFGSLKSVDSSLPSVFMGHCIDNNYGISYAWQLATMDVLSGNNQLVRLVFDTSDQLSNDHLPGQGTVSASETIDDDIIYYSEWRT